MREARDVMADLAGSGLSPDQLALVMELAAVVASEARPAVDTNANRRREKDRERKRNVRRIPQTSADSATETVSPTPPSERPPIPPLKGGTFPQTEQLPPEKPKAEVGPSLKVWVDRIWEISPTRARERSGRRDVERSLKAAVGRGKDPGRVTEGLEAYFASPDARKNDGEFVKGTHRMIEQDRWEAFVSERSTDPPPDSDPWTRRLREFQKNQYWNTTDWGPKPGKPGCRAPQAQAQTQAA